MDLTPRHVYRSETQRCVDADTLDVMPLPPVRLRLLGFDAAEMRDGTEETKALAGEQTEWVRAWLDNHPDLVTDDRGPDPFGRRLAWVYDRITGECLNLEFVRRWPETAANPRFQAATIFHASPEEMTAYRP